MHDIDRVRARAAAYTQKRFLDKKAAAIIEDLLDAVDELQRANNSLAMTFDNSIDQIPIVLESHALSPEVQEELRRLASNPRETQELLEAMAQARRKLGEGEGEPGDPD